MEQYKPKFAFVGDCSAGELVRLKVDEGSLWGVICTTLGGDLKAVVILSANEGAKVINIVLDGSTDFARIPALAYGKYGEEYILECDHTGQIIFVAGDMPKIPGCILQANNDLYLMARAESGRMHYISLSNFQIHSEPGGSRALVSRWRLIHTQITRDGVSLPLLEFDASKITTGQTKTSRPQSGTS